MMVICLDLCICFDTAFTDPSCSSRKIPSMSPHIPITQSRQKTREEANKTVLPREGGEPDRQENRTGGGFFTLKIHFCPPIRQHGIPFARANPFPPARLCCVPAPGLLTVMSQPSDDTALLEKQWES